MYSQTTEIVTHRSLFKLNDMVHILIHNCDQTKECGHKLHPITQEVIYFDTGIKYPDCSSY